MSDTDEGNASNESAGGVAGRGGGGGVAAGVGEEKEEKIEAKNPPPEEGLLDGATFGGEGGFSVPVWYTHRKTWACIRRSGLPARQQ